MSAVHAQSAGQSENQTSLSEGTTKAPMATVTFAQKPQPSQLILKVKMLCQGDERLTEMVIAEIYKQKDLQIKDVITDTDFSLFNCM